MTKYNLSLVQQDIESIRSALKVSLTHCGETLDQQEQIRREALIIKLGLMLNEGGITSEV